MASAAAMVGLLRNSAHTCEEILMHLSHVPKKDRSVTDGLLRTIPFAAAGILALILFYLQTSYTDPG